MSSRSYLFSFISKSFFCKSASFLASFFLTISVFNPLFALDIELVKSKKGVSAWLIESHNNPIISIRFAFTGGYAHDPEGLYGLAGLMSSTLDEGAGPYNGQSFQRLLDENYIGLRFSAYKEHIKGYLKTTTEDSDLAFELLRLSVNEPLFDEGSVRWIKSQTQLNLEGTAKQPEGVSEAAMSRLVFGDHPFGNNADGEVETLDQIKPDDLREFHGKHFSKKGLMVAVVGDISPDDLRARLDQVFGDLPDKDKTEKIEPISNRNPGKAELFEFDQPQTDIYMVQDGVGIDSPDYLPLVVVNHILGGASNKNRLFNELREKRGLTYGVSTSFSAVKGAGFIFGNVQTANETAAQALDILTEQWRLMAEEGPTQEELDSAVKYLIGAYGRNFGNTLDIADELLALQINGRPMTYIEDRKQQYESLGLEDLKRVSKKILDPEALTIVLTGKPQGLKVEDGKLVKVEN